MSEPILHFNAFVGSPLKRPLTLLPEGYIRLYLPSEANIPRPPAPDVSGSVWDTIVDRSHIYRYPESEGKFRPPYNIQSASGSSPDIF